MEHLKTILDIFRTYNIILNILFISSGLITFNVLNLRDHLGLTSLSNFYFAVIGLTFVISGSCLISLLVNTLFGGLDKRILKFFDDRKVLKNMDKTFSNLSNGEIIILSEYYFNRLDTLWMPRHATEITSLVSKGILYLSHMDGLEIPPKLIIYHYSINPVIKDKVFTSLNNLYENSDDEKIQKFYDDFAPNYLCKIREAKERLYL